MLAKNSATPLWRNVIMHIRRRKTDQYSAPAVHPTITDRICYLCCLIGAFEVRASVTASIVNPANPKDASNVVAAGLPSEPKDIDYPRLARGLLRSRPDSRS